MLEKNSVVKVETEKSKEMGSTEKANFFMPSPKQLYNHLSDFVIGQ